MIKFMHFRKFAYLFLAAAVLLVAVFNIADIFEPAAAVTEPSSYYETDYLPVRAAMAEAEDIDEAEINIPQQTTSEAPTPSETKDLYSHIAARWVDGQVVPMTDAEIAAFEKALYQCQTQSDYEAKMSELAYYNKGIDLSKFSWYWDDLEDLYSDEQMALLRAGSKERKPMPDIYGMEVSVAYRFLTNQGFIGRFYYVYNPNCDLPVGTCYWQDGEPGGMWNVTANFFIRVQAPKEINHQMWDPDNPVDIDALAADIRENGSYHVFIPDVIGLPETEAIALLEEAGFNNIFVSHNYVENDVEIGICFKQDGTPGSAQLNTSIYCINIKSKNPIFEIPDFVGMTETEAISYLTEKDQPYTINYVDEPESGLGAGFVVRQAYPEGDVISSESVMLIYVQKDNSPEPIETTVETTIQTTETLQEPTPVPEDNTSQPTTQVEASETASSIES